MNKIKCLSLVAFAAILCGCNGQAKTGQGTKLSTSDSTQVTEAQDAATVQTVGEVSSEAEATPAKKSSAKVDGVQRLKAAYPQKIKDISNNTIYFVDGTTMVYDDGKQKDFVTMLDNSDPEDMFFDVYDTSVITPGYLQDVGRSRSEQLFKKLYGSSAAEVQKQLVSVPWFGQNVKFSSSNNAAAQLKKVQAELAELVKKKPELKKYLKSSGTFYWRPVRGAKRLSAHSYGMAIDIAVDNSDYWLWRNKGASETTKIKYANRIPMEIVEVFEKYGFVWGGRWYHYDTMHFEYRPELNPPRQ